MGKKRELSHEQLLRAIERFVDELDMDERNFEAFCRGVLRLLRYSVPIDQFQHKKNENVIPFPNPKWRKRK